MIYLLINGCLWNCNKIKNKYILLNSKQREIEDQITLKNVPLHHRNFSMIYLWCFFSPVELEGISKTNQTPKGHLLEGVAGAQHFLGPIFELLVTLRRVFQILRPIFMFLSIQGHNFFICPL